MAEKTVSLIGLWMLLFTVNSAFGQGKPCFDQLDDMASDCAYKCHCADNDYCDTDTGDCTGHSTCAKGWFGPACQYADLMYTYHSASTPEYLRDGDDRTCSADQTSQSVTASLNQTFPFTWLRLVSREQDLQLIRSLDVQLHGLDGNDTVMCHNMRAVPDRAGVLDVHCDGEVAVQSVSINGDGVSSLCSLYFSGGRNIALRESAIQSSTYPDSPKLSGAQNAVDGNTTGIYSRGSCSHTNESDTNPYWKIEFSSQRIINRYVLFNRVEKDGCCPERLQGFLLTSYTADNRTVLKYQDTEPEAQEVYRFTSVGNTTPVSYVVIRATNIVDPMTSPVLTLCEVEIYGDSVCPAGKFGFECNETCDYCSTAQDTCEVSTGACLSGCMPGFYGQRCDMECPENFYGPDCKQRCSVHCEDQLCDKETGKCLNCVEERQGDFCEECPDKFYGQDCTEECSTYCAHQLCNSTTGFCYECEAGKRGDYCTEEPCPSEYCKNGGICIGQFTCDCSATGFFGPTCQATRDEIPITAYKFVGIDLEHNIVITSSGNLTYHGFVTLHQDGDGTSMAIATGSYLRLDGPIKASCLDDIDDCTSGFTFTNGHSFSSVDSTMPQVVLTTGAGLEDDTRGVSLYYQAGYVYCYVATSRHLWSIVQQFSLVANEVYNMTVSWHVGQGLDLLQGNKVIGSSATPSRLTQQASVSKPLLVGSEDDTSSAAVMNVKDLITSPVFWKEIQRAEIYFTEKKSSDGSALEIAQVVGIAVGCLAALIIAVVAVVGLLHYIRRGSKKLESPSSVPRQDNAYITPSDYTYSMGSSTIYTDYHDSNRSDAIPPPDYDYIPGDYITIEPDPAMSFRNPAFVSNPKGSVEYPYMKTLTTGGSEVNIMSSAMRRGTGNARDKTDYSRGRSGSLGSIGTVYERVADGEDRYTPWNTPGQTRTRLGRF